MATIALGLAGGLVGGPIGSAFGALLGRQVDSKIFGGGSAEGPRLDELTIATSSYGMPLAKHFGQMRTAGTIIWATDLTENRETNGGGKGKPKSTSFSYSTSFAVALSSRPIDRLGRIWADGMLLRGAAGDLKTGGTLRIYHGHGDQTADPLMASAIGASCPAFRGRACVVFEDLQLEDYGNRIPALSFEVFADDFGFSLGDIVEPLVDEADVSVPLSQLAGFSYERGSLAETIGTIGNFYPLQTRITRGGVQIVPAPTREGPTIALPEPMPAWDDDEFGQDNGILRERDAGETRSLSAMRYYDTSRDYQAGVQRPGGRADQSGASIAEFPAALSPNDARLLVSRASSFAQSAKETLRWRTAELDPAIGPGALVTAPGVDGTWVVNSWEWRERGVELELERAPRLMEGASLGDTGNPILPPDNLLLPTQLRVFELPWDGNGSSNESRIFAALSSESEIWAGASLFADSGGPLIPLGQSGRSQATMGALTESLAPSASIVFEPNSMVEVETASNAMTFASVDIDALAVGHNRLLVGDEIIQFVTAIQSSARRWKLQGLLRGRGGTERAASIGHVASTPVTLADSSLVPLDSAQLALAPSSTISAIGRGDDEPVIAAISNRGVGLKPLRPVHPRTHFDPIGQLVLCWTRRARGAWTWLDGVETALIEAEEIYRVGIGDTAAPDAVWEVGFPALTLTSEQVATYSGSDVWVRQGGRAAYSDPLLLAQLP